MADELDHLAETMLSHVEHELARARITPSPEQRSGDAMSARSSARRFACCNTPRRRALHWAQPCPDDMTVPIDPHDFRELAGNLLENAAKWPRAKSSSAYRGRPRGFD